MGNLPPDKFNDLVITLAGVLVGAVLGFVMAYLAEWLRLRRQAGEVREIVSAEVDLNLSRLKEYWGSVLGLGLYTPAEYARIVARNVLPTFSREAFNSQMPMLSLAVHGTALRQLLDLYGKLARLGELQARLEKFEQTERADGIRISETMRTDATVVGVDGPTYMEKRAPPLWVDFKECAEGLIDVGNPLRTRRRNSF